MLQVFGLYLWFYPRSLLDNNIQSGTQQSWDKNHAVCTQLKSGFVWHHQTKQQKKVNGWSVSHSVCVLHCLYMKAVIWSYTLGGAQKCQ